jgi:hypothetical protein
MAKREAEYTTTFVLSSLDDSQSKTLAFSELGRKRQHAPRSGISGTTIIWTTYPLLGTQQKEHASRSGISGTTIIWTTYPLFVNLAVPRSTVGP